MTHGPLESNVRRVGPRLRFEIAPTHVALCFYHRQILVVPFQVIGVARLKQIRSLLGFGPGLGSLCLGGFCFQFNQNPLEPLVTQILR